MLGGFGEPCDLCFDLFFDQIGNETLNSLFDSALEPSPGRVASTIPEVCLTAACWISSLTSSSIDPSCSRTHIGQCGANGVGLFADHSIDALFDQRARDFENAVPDDGFEEAHFAREDLRECRGEQRFKHLCQPLLREGRTHLRTHFCFHRLGHEEARSFPTIWGSRSAIFFSVRSDMD